MRRRIAWSTAALVIGAVLLLAARAIGIRLAAAWLTSVLFWSTSLVGVLAWSAILNASGARWFAPLRARSIGLTSALPVLALAFLPVVVSLASLYPWAGAPPADEHARELLHHRGAWLRKDFFVGRMLLCWLVWIASSEYLLRRERHLPGFDLIANARRRRSASSISVLLVGLALALAGVDWMMSLDPVWYSTMAGVYFATGALAGGMSLMAVVAASVPGARSFARPAIGQLLFTSVILWAYIGFGQFFVIWMGDLPHEVGWYLDRGSGAWAVASLVLGLTHFVIPGFALLPAAPKSRPAFLAAAGMWLLLAHYLDIRWMVGPELGMAAMPGIADLGALLVVGGVAALTVIVRTRGQPPRHVPEPEPGRPLAQES